MAYIRKNRLALIKKYILIAVILFSILVLSAAGYTFTKAQNNQRVNTPAAAKSSKDEKLIVRAKVKLGAGEQVDITKFEMVSVPVKLIPGGAIFSISDLKNKRLKNNLSENEMVLISDIIPVNAWYEDGDRLVEHNFTEGAVPASVDAGSQIDIKLFKQGAEDSVVISKASVVSRSANLLSFYLNADEQENIKEASTEGVLFVVEYIDASQTPSEISYVPGYMGKKIVTPN